MNSVQQRAAWAAVLIFLSTSIGCNSGAIGEANSDHPESVTESVTEVENAAPSEPPFVDPTEPVLVADTPPLPAGATLLDPDMVWDMWNPDSFAISPDGQSIAYISRGALWLCSVKSGPPKKLVDLPNTVTELRSTSKDYRKRRGEFNKLDSEVKSSLFYHRLRKGLTLITNLKWAPSQDGVFYVVENRKNEMPYTRTHRVMHVTTNGVATTVATITRDTFDKPQYFWRFDVSRDRSLVVASGYKALLWDATTDKPRATCYDYLLPSVTSGRFLGIEIDTRQLVITDDKLKIEKRLDVAFNPREFTNMFWSPDERFAICASLHEHAFENKNRWVGFRINLETGEQRPLKGGHFSTRDSIDLYVVDQFVFTGRGGEIIRTGRTDVVRRGYADGRNGTYLILTPDGTGPRKNIFQFTKPPQQSDDWRKENPYPPVRLSSAGAILAAAFPREGILRGHRYWLINRDGKKWPMELDDLSLCASPYHVIALAGNGRQVIACNDVQLFSIPVATLQNTEEAKDE